MIAWAGEPMARLTPLKQKKRRGRGILRGWGADVPTEVFLAPMDEADLDAAEGKFSDEFGISLSEADRKWGCCSTRKPSYGGSDILQNDRNPP